MSTQRDRIRSKTVGAVKMFREEKVTIKMGDEAVDFVVRQPTVEERGLIFASAGAIDGEKNAKIDPSKLQINAVICLTCVPGPDGKASAEKAFEEADRDSLAAQPTGGWFDDLAKAAVGQLNFDLDDAKKG